MNIPECRFVKPVYPGMTCHPGLDPEKVRCTVKASSSRLSGKKVDQGKRTPEDVAKGIVKFLVDVFDETRLRLASARNAGETEAIATILTTTVARPEWHSAG